MARNDEVVIGFGAQSGGVALLNEAGSRQRAHFQGDGDVAGVVHRRLERVLCHAGGVGILVDHLILDVVIARRANGQRAGVRGVQQHARARGARIDMDRAGDHVVVVGIVGGGGLAPRPAAEVGIVDRRALAAGDLRHVGQRARDLVGLFVVVEGRDRPHVIVAPRDQRRAVHRDNDAVRRRRRHPADRHRTACQRLGARVHAALRVKLVDKARDAVVLVVNSSRGQVKAPAVPVGAEGRRADARRLLERGQRQDLRQHHIFCSDLCFEARVIRGVALQRPAGGISGFGGAARANVYPRPNNAGSICRHRRRIAFRVEKAYGNLGIPGRITLLIDLRCNRGRGATRRLHIVAGRIRPERLVDKSSDVDRRVIGGLYRSNHHEPVAMVGRQIRKCEMISCAAVGKLIEIVVRVLWIGNFCTGADVDQIDLLFFVV